MQQRGDAAATPAPAGAKALADFSPNPDSQLDIGRPSGGCHIMVLQHFLISDLISYLLRVLLLLLLPCASGILLKHETSQAHTLSSSCLPQRTSKLNAAQARRGTKDHWTRPLLHCEWPQVRSTQTRTKQRRRTHPAASFVQCS